MLLLCFLGKVNITFNVVSAVVHVSGVLIQAEGSNILTCDYTFNTSSSISIGYKKNCIKNHT